MTWLWTTLFAILFFALLMASVALHEVGHMWPAKAFGVKVPKYFVGFGKTLWSIRRGDTEYGIKLFPLGGFVQLLGMYPPHNPDAKPSRLQRWADEVRGVEWDDITPADHGRLFYEKPTWQKLIIMAGGPMMNILICFLLLWAVMGLHGTWQPQTQVSRIQPCVIVEAREDMTCRATDPKSPAADAGLRAGDVIVEFNGTPVRDYPQLGQLIRANMDGELRLVVQRDGVRTDLTPTHTRISGVPDRLDPSKRVPAGWLGVYPEYELVKGTPVDVVSTMWTMTEQSVVALSQFPVKVWNVVADMMAGKPRDVNGPISIVGASVVAGEVASSDNPVTEKVILFASLLASVNLFLALFNFVPLPPLDGGHIAGALYEWLRRAWARLRGRPDPGPVDTAKLLPVAYAVGAFLLLCGVVLIVADIISPVKIL